MLFTLYYCLIAYLSDIRIDGFRACIFFGILCGFLVQACSDGCIKLSRIFFMYLSIFAMLYLPAMLYPHVEYKNYLQQLSDEESKVAQNFSLEMGSKSDFDIYNELHSRVKKGDKEYLILQSKLEQVKKNDKRRESLLWMYQAIFNDFKTSINREKI